MTTHRPTDYRHITVTADEKKAGAAPLSFLLTCGDPVEHGSSANPRSNRFRNSNVIAGVFYLALILVLIVILPFAWYSSFSLFVVNQFEATISSPSVLRHYVRTTATSLLEVFQVYPPVLTVTPDGVLEIADGSSNPTVDIIDGDRLSCQKTLVSYSFANSYGAPFVSNYTPPHCAFNRVTWNLTVTSAGRQFDRLGTVSLGDVEVLRTSTAEPTVNGIQWTYLKVSRISSLLRSLHTLTVASNRRMSPTSCLYSSKSRPSFLTLAT